MGTHASTIASTFEGAPSRPPLPGFRHFLEDPGEARRFRIHGLDPLASPQNLERLRGLMCRLSRRMDADIEWPPHAGSREAGSREAGSCEDWENPQIPAGYTYLLQLVAHDLVQSAVPLSFTAQIHEGTRNLRRARLKLDTLYGAGPVASPFAYALDDGADRSRTKLRLGRIQRDDRTSDEACPFRDIARASAENLTGIDRGLADRPALTDALIIDPRNDDHAILSQMAALFALLHNGIVDLILRGEPRVDARSPLEAAHRRFLCARGATTLLYRRILRDDVMKRLLHPAIYAAYASRTPIFLDEGERERARPGAGGEFERDASRLPLEFSHGVFRFGHSLVRNRYRINDIATNELAENLQKTSMSDPINMPLNESWIVQWSQFFEIGGSRPNLSRRIGPKFSDALGSDQIFPAIDGTKRVSARYDPISSGSRHSSPIANGACGASPPGSAPSPNMAGSTARISRRSRAIRPCRSSSCSRLPSIPRSKAGSSACSAPSWSRR
jgi:hypothetical protein